MELNTLSSSGDGPMTPAPEEEGRPLQGELGEPIIRRSTPQTKSDELLRFFRDLSLEGCFQLWGRAIGSCPYAFLIAGVILCSLSLGMINLKLKDNVRDGYTPSTSRARFENDVYRQFLDSEGDPALTTVLMLAKDNGSMHREEYLYEAVQQMIYLSKNLSATVNGNQVTYQNFCGHYCKSNVVLSYFLLALDDKKKTGAKSLTLTYPIAEMRGMKVHLERNFYGVKVAKEDFNVTNIEHLTVISLSFLAEVKTSKDLDRLNAWEMAVYEYASKYTANPANNIEMLAIGCEVVDTEMNKDGQRMAPYLVTGISVMFVFVCITISGSSLYFNRLSKRTVIVAISCAVVPLLAVTTTLGLSNLLGNRTNSLMLIMPFLIMGIGVNDSFLTVHAWLRLPLRTTEAERLGEVLREVGPSITTTTLTNVVTFMIGWLTPTEEISIFCLGCALALGFAYIYTIILFCPVLYFCSSPNREESVKNTPGWRIQLRKAINSFVHFYCRLLENSYFVIILLFAACFYWYFGVMGTISMSAKLDTGKILPQDSPVRRPNRLIEDYLWKEYYPVTIVVNNPVNIEDPAQMKHLKEFVDEFEDMPTCRGKDFTMFWLRDYEKYFSEVATDIFDYDQEDVVADERAFGYSKLKGFLGSPIYEHNKAFVRVDYNETVPVRKFTLMVTYENTSSWDDRINLMQKWREIADRYPQLNATVWNVNAMFVDQMLSLKSLTTQTCLWTLLCMAIVCTIFIQNPISVVMATVSIASISLGVMGYLSFWHLDLDPVTLCAVLISIGMAVDFVAHTTYHYQLSHRHAVRGGEEVLVPLSRPYDRLRHTITNIAWPMTQAGLSTVICILPLVALKNYVPLVFVKTITLVVIWGLFHGLTLLPAVLGQIPLDLLSFNCYRAITTGRGGHEPLAA